jgi:hypothetical protein
MARAGQHSFVWLPFKLLNETISSYVVIIILDHISYRLMELLLQSLVTALEEKINEKLCSKLHNFHCILYQEALCVTIISLENILKMLFTLLIYIPKDYITDNLLLPCTRRKLCSHSLVIPPQTVERI